MHLVDSLVDLGDPTILVKHTSRCVWWIVCVWPWGLYPLPGSLLSGSFLISLLLHAMTSAAFFHRALLSWCVYVTTCQPRTKAWAKISFFSFKLCMFGIFINNNYVIYIIHNRNIYILWQNISLIQRCTHEILILRMYFHC